MPEGYPLTLLLFAVGLEVNFGALLASGKTLLLRGLLQVSLTVVTGFAAVLAVRALGVSTLDGTKAPSPKPA